MSRSTRILASFALAGAFALGACQQGTGEGEMEEPITDETGMVSGEVPLGEEREAYLVRVTGGGSVLREVETGERTWRYSPGEQAADDAGGFLRFEVAQLSVRFGAGPFERIETDV